MSREVFEQLKLITREKEPLKTVVANGDSFTTNKTTEFELQLKGLSNNGFHIEPYLFEHCNHDVILGGDFVFPNNCVLDYKNKLVICGSKMLKWTGYEEETEKTLD